MSVVDDDDYKYSASKAARLGRLSSSVSITLIQNWGTDLTAHTHKYVYIYIEVLYLVQQTKTVVAD